ncbi:hypothetical protein [Streptomyces sp. GbtcB6]|uniref:hypothetical protein n=1 Tax=Streptomyces sp. GbtcB6 TaxID=2824751 RepID=UPI001C305F44|nr:hypothetical protein [Streptomyces sp. GbtcB6]
MISDDVAVPLRHHVVVLSLPGVLPLELGIAAQIFAMDPNYELRVATYEQVVPVARSGCDSGVRSWCGEGGLSWDVVDSLVRSLALAGSWRRL